MNIFRKIVNIIVISSFLCSNSVSASLNPEKNCLTQISQLNTFINEWQTISLILAVYDMYGFKEHGKITADEIESTERIKETLREKFRAGGQLDMYKDDVNNIKQIYLGNDHLIYIKYSFTDNEILMRLAPQDLKDDYQILYQSNDIRSNYALQVVNAKTKHPDSRGWEGLPNEEYTPAIREALASKEFACIEYNPYTNRFEIAKFKYDDRREKNGNISLTSIDLDKLNEAIRQLEIFYSNLLKDTDTNTNKRAQIIFMHNQSGHYGISRNQYYLDIDLLNNSELLKAKLLHELAERWGIVTDPQYKNWRKNRDRSNIETQIKEAAKRIHDQLITEEIRFRPLILTRLEAKERIKEMLRMPKDKGPNTVETYRENGISWEDECNSNGTIIFTWTDGKGEHQAKLCTGGQGKGKVKVDLNLDSELGYYVFRTERNIGNEIIITTSRFAWNEKKSHWVAEQFNRNRFRVTEMLKMSRDNGPNTVNTYREKGISWEDESTNMGTIRFTWTDGEERHDVILSTGKKRKGKVKINLNWDSELGYYVFTTKREVDGETIINTLRFAWDEKKGHWAIEQFNRNRIRIIEILKSADPNKLEKYKETGISWEDDCGNDGIISFAWTDEKSIYKVSLSTGKSKKGKVKVDLNWDSELGYYVFKTERKVDNKNITTTSRFVWDTKKGHWGIEQFNRNSIRIIEMLKMPEENGPNTVETYKERGISWEDKCTTNGSIIFAWTHEKNVHKVSLSTGKTGKGKVKVNLNWDNELGYYVFKTERNIGGQTIVCYSRFEWSIKTNRWMIKRIKIHQMYRDKQSVEEAFERRRSKNLKNSAWALIHGRKPDKYLYEASRKFNVPLEVESRLDEEYNRESEIASVKYAGWKEFNVREKNRVIRMIETLITGKEKELGERKNNPAILNSQIRLLKELLDRLRQGNMGLSLPLLELLRLRAPETISQRGLTNNIEYLNQDVGADPYQNAMVRLGMNPKTRVLLVQGGPGSGKSTALTEMIYQLIKAGKNVLLVTHDNSALDNILEKLDQAMLPILRATSARDRDEIEQNEKISPYTKRFCLREKMREGFQPQFDEGGRKEFLRRRTFHSGMVLGVTADSVSINRAVRDFDSSVVVIDEAGLCDTADTIIPAIKAREKIIIAGDHKQLPPFFKEHEYREYDEMYRRLLRESSLGRSWDRGYNQVFLARNYRSHPLIAHLVGRLFYDRMMVPKPWTFMESDTIRIVDTPMDGNKANEKDIALEGGQRFQREPSYQNSKEAEKCIEEFDRAIKSGYPAAEITIITGYAGQLELIKARLKEYLQGKHRILIGHKNIDTYLDEHVLTINQSQGRENGVIILSFVRSNPDPYKVGFMGNLQRLNVALSRAKDRLVLIGDMETLRQARLTPDDKIFAGQFSQIQNIISEYDVLRDTQIDIGGFTIHEAIQKANGIEGIEIIKGAKIRLDEVILRHMSQTFLNMDHREYNKAHSVLEELNELALEFLSREEEPVYGISEEKYNDFINNLKTISSKYHFIKMDKEGNVDLLWLKDEKGAPIRVQIAKEVETSGETPSSGSRSWEGLPNEEYTPAIKEALANKEFACIEYNPETKRFDTAKFRYDDEQKENGNIILAPDDLNKLNEAISQLELFYTDLLKDTEPATDKKAQILFMCNQSGHYGISRNQYYLDINLLNNPELLKAKLLHEIKERLEIIGHEDYVFWKHYRGEPKIEQRIAETARKKHAKLVNEERKLRCLEAFSALENIANDAIKGNKDLDTKLGEISGLLQNMNKAERLQFVVPMSVLRQSPDIINFLKKIKLFGQRDRTKKFELIIYDVENEEEAEGLRDLIRELTGLTTDALGIYPITKSKIRERNNGQDPGTSAIKTAIVKDYVKKVINGKTDMEEKEYMLIVTDTAAEVEAAALETGLRPLLEKNISIEIPRQPTEGNIISALSLIHEWLSRLKRGDNSFINIILPVSISPAELRQKLEGAAKNAWQLLSAA